MNGLLWIVEKSAKGTPVPKGKGIDPKAIKVPKLRKPNLPPFKNRVPVSEINQSSVPEAKTPIPGTSTMSLPGKKAVATKYAGLGDMMQMFQGENKPQWYGDETAYYDAPYKDEKTEVADKPKSRGITHKVAIRDAETKGMLNEIFGFERSSITRARVPEIVDRLRALGLDVTNPEEGAEELEFGYAVGAGEPGAEMKGGKRTANPLPKELRQKVDNILYDLEEKQATSIGYLVTCITEGS